MTRGRPKLLRDRGPGDLVCMASGPSSAARGSGASQRRRGRRRGPAGHQELDRFVGRSLRGIILLPVKLFRMVVSAVVVPRVCAPTARTADYITDESADRASGYRADVCDSAAFTGIEPVTATDCECLGSLVPREHAHVISVARRYS